MVSKSMTLYEAERTGLISIAQDAHICELAQFVPCEDDGQSYGIESL
jgi:hypothetical protein